MNTEEWMRSSGNDVSQIAKGKRSKRQRLSNPNGGSGIMMTCSSSSTASGGVGHGGESGDYVDSFSSTICCNYGSTEDEEDTANCLILLARGDSAKQVKDGGSRKRDKFSSRKFADIATSNTACKTGFFVYECKTCKRAFPSFQALGGHRASHRKNKVITTVENKSSPPSPPSVPAPRLQPSDDNREVELEGEEQSHVKSNMTLPPAHHHQIPAQLSLSAIRGMNQHKAKIHECLICGSDFSSGQALGGHMRRHRAATSIGQMVGLNISHDNNITTTINDMDIKPRNNVQELDLNLPAPEEDNRDSSSKFQYAPTDQRSLALSVPALVDCHY